MTFSPVPRIFAGKAFAADRMARLRAQVYQEAQQSGRELRIHSIFPHEDEASVLYTKLKQQDAAKVGIAYTTQGLSLHDPEKKWMEAIQQANADKNIHGILIQKPSSVQFSATTGKSREEFHAWWQRLTESLSPEKDVDCLTPWRLLQLQHEAGRVEQGSAEPQQDLSDWIFPATAQAVIDIALFALNGDVAELRTKKVAVIGRSLIVGQPAALGFTMLGAQTKLLSARQPDISVLQNADIIISATGNPQSISANQVKEGAILIDVGSPKPEFSEEAQQKSAFYTPVPGGVGPVTRSCLLENLLKIVV